MCDGQSDKIAISRFFKSKFFLEEQNLTFSTLAVAHFFLNGMQVFFFYAKKSHDRRLIGMWVPVSERTKFVSLLSKKKEIETTQTHIYIYIL